jgi:hypothetical protein
MNRHRKRWYQEEERSFCSARSLADGVPASSPTKQGQLKHSKISTANLTHLKTGTLVRIHTRDSLVDRVVVRVPVLLLDRLISGPSRAVRYRAYRSQHHTRPDQPNNPLTNLHRM